MGPASAHRQLQPGPAVGHLGGVPPPGAPRPDHVRPDDRRVLDLHRHPGHPAGHLRDLRRDRGQTLRRHARRHDHPDRGPGRHGRRPAAGRDHERRRGHLRRLRPVPDHPADRVRLPGRAGRRHRRRHPPGHRRPRQGRPLSIGLLGNAADVFPAMLAKQRPDRHRHRPDLRPRPADLPAPGRRLRGHGRPARRGPGGLHRPSPRVDGRPRRRHGRLPRRRRRGLRLRQLHPRRGRTGRLPAGVRLPRLRPGLHPAAVLRGQGPVPLGRAVRRPRRTSPPPTRPSSSCSRRTRPWPGGSGWPRRRSTSRACPPGSAGSATASGTWPACASTRWWPSGTLQAPIVLGRDHLDCGSVASPYRETEAWPTAPTRSPTGRC